MLNNASAMFKPTSLHFHHLETAIMLYYAEYR